MSEYCLELLIPSDNNFKDFEKSADVISSLKYKLKEFF